MTLTLAVICVCAYLLGSSPFGKWIADAHGVNILDSGSKNIGATNVWRTLGPKAGMTVFLLDALKGYVPALVGGFAQVLFGDGLTFYPTWALLTGGSALLGHSFSVFLRFRGGKSVAASLGVVLAISPLVAGIAFALFLLLFGITRYVSLSSIIAVASAPILAACFRFPVVVVAAYVVIASLIVYRHKANIRRLLNGEEYRFGSRDESRDSQDRQIESSDGGADDKNG